MFVRVPLKNRNKQGLAYYPVEFYKGENEDTFINKVLTTFDKVESKLPVQTAQTPVTVPTPAVPTPAVPTPTVPTPAVPTPITAPITAPTPTVPTPTVPTPTVPTPFTTNNPISGVPNIQVIFQPHIEQNNDKGSTVGTLKDDTVRKKDTFASENDNNGLDAVKKVNKKLEECLNEKVDLSKKVNKLQSDFNRQEIEKDQIQNNLNGIQKDLNDKNTKVQDLSLELSQYKNTCSIKEQRQTKKNNDLQEEYDKLLNVRNECLKTKEDLIENIKKLEINLQDNVQDKVLVAKLEASIKSLEESLSTSTKNFNDLKNKFEKDSSDQSLALIDLENTQENTKKLEKNLSLTITDLGNTHSEKKKLEKNLENCIQKSSKLSKEIDDIQDTIRKNNEEINENNIKLISCQEKSRDNLLKLEECNKNSVNYKDLYELSDSNKNELLSRIKKLEEDNKRLLFQEQLYRNSTDSNGQSFYQIQDSPSTQVVEAVLDSPSGAQVVEAVVDSPLVEAVVDVVDSPLVEDAESSFSTNPTGVVNVSSNSLSSPTRDLMDISPQQSDAQSDTSPQPQPEASMDIATDSPNNQIEASMVEAPEAQIDTSSRDPMETDVSQQPEASMDIATDSLNNQIEASMVEAPEAQIDTSSLDPMEIDLDQDASQQTDVSQQPEASMDIATDSPNNQIEASMVEAPEAQIDTSSLDPMEIDLDQDASQPQLQIDTSRRESSPTKEDSTFSDQESPRQITDQPVASGEPDADQPVASGEINEVPSLPLKEEKIKKIEQKIIKHAEEKIKKIKIDIQELELQKFNSQDPNNQIQIKIDELNYWLSGWENSLNPSPPSPSPSPPPPPPSPSPPPPPPPPSLLPPPPPRTFIQQITQTAIENINNIKRELELQKKLNSQDPNNKVQTIIDELQDSLSDWEDFLRKLPKRKRVPGMGSTPTDSEVKNRRVLPREILSDQLDEILTKELVQQQEIRDKIIEILKLQENDIEFSKIQTKYMNDMLVYIGDQILLFESLPTGSEKCFEIKRDITRELDETLKNLTDEKTYSSIFEYALDVYKVYQILIKFEKRWDKLKAIKVMVREKGIIQIGGAPKTRSQTKIDLEKDQDKTSTPTSTSDSTILQDTDMSTSDSTMLETPSLELNVKTRIINLLCNTIKGIEYGPFTSIIPGGTNNLDLFTGCKNSMMDKNNKITTSKCCPLSEMGGYCDVIDQLKNGDSVLLFSYGQSGSGKTYTLFGDEKNVGLVQMTIINSEAESFKIKKIFEVKINSAGSNFTDIKDIKIKSQINNLTDQVLGANKNSEFEVSSSNDIFKQTLDRISDVRKKTQTILPTPYNPVSSRSHLFIEVMLKYGEKVSKLIVCDLGGREGFKELANMFYTSDTPEGLNNQNIGSFFSGLTSIRRKTFTQDQVRWSQELNELNRDQISNLLQQSMFINESLNHLEFFLKENFSKGYPNVEAFFSDKKFKPTRNQRDFKVKDYNEKKFLVRKNPVQDKGLKFEQIFSSESDPVLLYSVLKSYLVKELKIIMLCNIRSEPEYCESTKSTLEFANTISSV
jgi:hypothetical protein